MVEMAMRLLRHLPVGLLTRMGLATFVAPRTSGWSRAADAMREYIDEQHEKQEKALTLAEMIEVARKDAA
jgi:acyl CoA:acetate/3-ketoacid CoA transferase